MGVKGRRWVKTRAREAYWIGKNTEKGRAQAVVEAQRKKPLDVSAREHIGRFIDSLDADSVMKLAGWGSLTVLIKPVLQASEQLGSTIAVSQEALARTAMAFPQTSLFGNIWFMFTKVETGAQPLTKLIGENEVAWWLLAAGVAALIIIFGPAVLSSVGGITKLAGLLLAA